MLEDRAKRPGSHGIKMTVIVPR